MKIKLGGSFAKPTLPRAGAMQRKSVATQTHELPGAAENLAQNQSLLACLKAVDLSSWWTRGRASPQVPTSPAEKVVSEAQGADPARKLQNPPELKNLEARETGQTI